MKKPNRPIAWVNSLFITFSPIAAIAGVIWCVNKYGIHWMDIVLFVVLQQLSGMAITTGYHRLYAHKSYTCHPLLEIPYLLFGAASIENSALRWARDHRLHHQYVDTERDPYNIKQGFLYAHMGWIYFKSPVETDFSKVPDLLKNKLVAWQEKYYLPLGIGVGFVLPTLIGWSVGRPIAGFIWGGLLRVVVVHHLTFLINSAAHVFGTQPYSESDTARDSWWLAFFTWGEGYHNFHHRFPADYRNGHRWFHWDPAKWWIASMKKCGMVYRMSRHKDSQILRCKLDVEMRRVKAQIAQLPESTSTRIERRLAEAREKVEIAAARWHMAKNRYRAMRQSVVRDSTHTREVWKLKLAAYRRDFQAAQMRWTALTAGAIVMAGGAPELT